jgi:hypothetical protein
MVNLLAIHNWYVYPQGIAKAFSIAYHHVDIRRKTLRIVESAVAWMHRRCPNIHDIVFYMVEPDTKTSDYVLRKMLQTDEKGHPKIATNPPRLDRKDNLFRYEELVVLQFD